MNRLLAGLLRRKWLLAAFVLLGLGLPLALGTHWGSFNATAVHPYEEPVEVVIPAGAGFDGALAPLRDAGLLSNLLYFRILARWKGADRKIRAGTYRVQPGTKPGGLLEQLTRGGQGEEVVLRIPEGWTLYHIADRVEAKGLDTRENFIKLVTSPDTVKRFDLRGPSLEGYLFPDTYRFDPKAGADAVVERMVRRHRQVWKNLLDEHGRSKTDALRKAHNMAPRDLITLASIVEREAVVDDERPIIARVFLNRLKKGMPLQADPTCTYGPKIYKKKASPKLCKDRKSTYSTYVIDALPPGPISNPGRSSLEAVITPTNKETQTEYLYFVAKPGGRRHTFSKTYKAHRKAIPR